MDNPFTGIRLLIVEVSDLGETVIDEYDVDSTSLEEMRKTLHIHIEELKRNNPDKDYYLQEDNGGGPNQSQQILSNRDS